MGKVQINDEMKLNSSTATMIVDEKEFNNIFSDHRRKKMADIDEQDSALKSALQERDAEALKALLAKKKNEKVISMRTDRSLNFGVIGAGQAGSKIAQQFYDRGYSTIVINTARQDLDLLDIPDSDKFFMDFSGVGGGGAGRDLDIGRSAIQQYYGDIKNMISDKFSNSNLIVICSSGGGGTGSASTNVLIDICNDIGKPVVCIYALPGSSDDSQSQSNAFSTLAELSKRAVNQQLNSLIIVDNAKAENIYSDLSQTMFWSTVNKSVVEPLHAFNMVSAMPTEFEALDSLDFSKALLEHGNCVVVGTSTISPEVYSSNEMAIVEAIIDNLDHSLLADGFDLTQARGVGILLTARKAVLDTIPYKSFSYAFQYITTEYSSAQAFRGIYALPSDSDDITVHFLFAGLGLPHERIRTLQRKADEHTKNLALKQKASKDAMMLDIGKDKASAEADKVLERLKKKKNPVNMLLNNSRKNVVDRRR